MLNQPNNTHTKKIAIIGAGWAGCAAAVRLTQLGHQVTLFEASRTVGGRARTVTTQGHTIDNGQHILLGAYQQTLKLMQQIGIDVESNLLRIPLQIRYPKHNNGIDFIVPKLAAPWHVLFGLLFAKNMALADKYALIHFMRQARKAKWQLNIDCSVDELLKRFKQPPTLNRFLWQPLTVAALNTPPHCASAKALLTVLRDSFDAPAWASDMLIPRCNLSALLPKAAIDFVIKHGGDIQLGASIKQLIKNEHQWKLISQQGDTTSASNHDAVIIATPPYITSSLLADMGVPDVCKQLDQFRYEPMTTVYLQYPTHCKLPSPIIALAADDNQKHWGQFVFDQGHLNANKAGLFAVVISASHHTMHMPKQELVEHIAQQLAQSFKTPLLNAPHWHHVITEKRATFSCAVGVERPHNFIGLTNLVIAGDYTIDNYPATLESAVQSGSNAAMLLANG